MLPIFQFKECYCRVLDNKICKKKTDETCNLVQYYRISRLPFKNPKQLISTFTSFAVPTNQLCSTRGRPGKTQIEVLSIANP